MKFDKSLVWHILAFLVETSKDSNCHTLPTIAWHHQSSINFDNRIVMTQIVCDIESCKKRVFRQYTILLHQSRGVHGLVQVRFEAKLPLDSINLSLESSHPRQTMSLQVFDCHSFTDLTIRSIETTMSWWSSNF